MRRPRPAARTADGRTTRRPGRALATATAVVLLLGAPATAAVVGTDDAPTPTPATTAPSTVEPSVEPSVEPPAEPSTEAAPATEQPTDQPAEQPADGPQVAEPSVEAPVGTEPTDQPSTEPTAEPSTDVAPDGTEAPLETSTTAPTEADATTADEDTELLACASDGPQDVVVDLVRHGVVEVTWAPPIPLCGRTVEGYEITLDGQVESGYLLQYSGLSWQMSADPGPHTVSVVALTTDGRSQPTSTVVVMPEPGLTWPTAPQGVTAVQTGADEVTIAWSAPAVPGSSPVTGYDVGVGTTGWGNGYSLAADARSSVQDGLEPGVLYYLSVAAENESGGGPRVFVELELTTWEVPSVPRSVIASQSGPGEVTVGWDEPADAGSYPVSGYRVEVTSSGAAGLEAASTTATTVDHPSAARSATVGGLGAGSHVVRVSALNPAGSSEVASVQVVVVAQVIAPPPVEPTDKPSRATPVAVPVVAPGAAGRPVERSVVRSATAHQLARTGADAGVLALGALLSTALGAGLLVASRRRPAAER